MFKIEVKGVKELQSTFKHLDEELQKAVLESLQDGGQIVIASAKGRVAVDTGNLRDHIEEQSSYIQNGTAFQSLF